MQLRILKNDLRVLRDFTVGEIVDAQLESDGGYVVKKDNLMYWIDPEHIGDYVELTHTGPIKKHTYSYSVKRRTVNRDKFLKDMKLLQVTKNALQLYTNAGYGPDDTTQVKRLRAAIRERREYNSLDFEYEVTLRRKNTRSVVNFMVNDKSALRNIVRDKIKNYNSSLRHSREQLRELNRVIKNRKGMRRHYIGGVVHEAGLVAEYSKSRRRQLVFSSKSPENSKDHIGVEIEFISSQDQNFIADLLVREKLYNYVTLKDDGSVRSDNEHKYTHEIAVIAQRDEIHNIIKTITDLLTNEADCITNSSCGIHVHLDARNKNENHMAKSLFNCQDMLFKMVHKHRRNNDYCKPNDDHEWMSEDDDCEDRYYGINTAAYEKFSTIEVRIHSSSLNATKINNWIDLLIAISDARITSNIATVDELVNKVDINTKLAEYADKRIKLFAA